MIIDENQSHLLTILQIQPHSKQQTKQPPPHNNRPKQLLLYASSYLSIGYSNVIIDKYQLSPAHNILCINKLEISNNKNSPPPQQ